MKKILFSLIALLTVIVLAAQPSIVIKGKILNCPNRDNSFIEKEGFNPERLEGETIQTDFSIEEDGSFYVKIPKGDAFFARYLIHLGHEKTHLDLMAGDSLYMTLDANQFDESIRYKGQGAGRNNYRRDVFLTFWDPIAPTKIQLDDPSRILQDVDTLTTQKLKLLNKYLLSKEIDSSYYQFEKALIMNEKASQVLSAKKRFRHHSFSDSVSRQMDLILKSVHFQDDHFLRYPEFRELVLHLPAYMTAYPSSTREADLNREIKFAATHYTPVMQEYFNKENIRKYMRQASNISQKRALLNFFDNRFDTPVLQAEIQQQRSRLYLNRVANSELFQGAVVTIFALVMVILFLYVIIRLIRYSGQIRVKINVSRWLKIVFYLAAAFMALVYMNNIHAPLNGFPMVFLMFVTFLVHTYVLIPRYALQRHPHYYLLLGTALIVFAGGNMITKQVLGSLFEFLVLVQLFLGLILLSWISYYIHQMASGKSTLKELKKKNELNLEIAIHLGILFLVNLIFIAGGGNNVRLNVVLFFYSIILLFYFHTLFTYPRTFNKQKIGYFVGINVLIMAGASVLMIALDAFQSYRALQNIGVGTNLSELISTRNIRPDLLLVFTLLLIPSFLYFYIRNRLIAMETTGFRLYRKKEAELAQLKSQVNPHFLFNTLNTLYAFALKEGSDKTAECIAKLANLMRFMLDDMEKDTILLKREISYIRDYVKLQSIRSAVEHDISINVELEDEESYAIAPMLLIPFVENAFKHGMNPGKVSQLKIDIRAKDNCMQFVIENSVDESFQAYYKEKGFGIGIENVKSRLRHVYPGRHNLSIAKTNTSFIVILNIEG